MSDSLRVRAEMLVAQARTERVRPLGGYIAEITEDEDRRFRARIQEICEPPSADVRLVMELLQL